jgi:hypothetical protein
LVLQLIHQPRATKDEAVPVGDNATDWDEWGEFLHLSGQKFHDIDQIRQVIKETNSITEHDDCISLLPTTLTIYSSNIPTLTLIYLPDLTNLSFEGRPSNFDEEIRSVVRKHIAKPNVLILTIMAAAGDWRDSEELKLVREIDPDYRRTIFSVQESDIMADGTDFADNMAGQIFSLRSESFPSISRKLWDTKSTNPFSIILDNAEKFDSPMAYWNRHSCHEKAYPAWSLQQILVSHIKQNLHDIKNDIDVCLEDYSAELKSLGGKLLFCNSSEILLPLVSQFSKEYRTAPEFQSQETLSNGTLRSSRLRSIVHEHYSNTINAIDPFTSIKDVEIRSILCCSGVGIEDFVSSHAFEFIIRALARKLKGPSINCVELVHEELLSTMDKLLRMPALQRYPELRENFRNVLVGFLTNAKDSTTKLVLDVVAMEAGNNNIRHPDLLSGHRAMAIVNERHKASGLVRLGIKAKVEMPKHDMKVEAAKLLLASYFELKRRAIIDMVPKAIVLKLVEYTQNEMERELLKHLYNSQQLENLLKEIERSIRRHEDCQRMVQCLTKAKDIISQF